MIAHVIKDDKKWVVVILDEDAFVDVSLAYEDRCTVSAKYIGRFKTALSATKAAIKATTALVIFMCKEWVDNDEEEEIKKALNAELIPFFIN